MSDDGASIYPAHDQQDDHACPQCGLLTDHDDGNGYPSHCAMCAEPSLSDEPTMGPHDDCALCAAGASDAHAIDCGCSEEYGHCEGHSELLVSREGAPPWLAQLATFVRDECEG